jgi:hypothetical protein
MHGNLSKAKVTINPWLPAFFFSFIGTTAKEGDAIGKQAVGDFACIP